MEYWLIIAIVALILLIGYVRFMFSGEEDKQPEEYEVYGGPLDGTWTQHKSLEGYDLVEDDYSGRSYYVFRYPRRDQK